MCVCVCVFSDSPKIWQLWNSQIQILEKVEIRFLVWTFLELDENRFPYSWKQSNTLFHRMHMCLMVGCETSRQLRTTFIFIKFVWSLYMNFFFLMPLPVLIWDSCIELRFFT